MDLTGAQIKAILNEQWNGNNEARRDRKILQVSGLSYTWDVSDAGVAGRNAIVGDVLIDTTGTRARRWCRSSEGTTYRVAWPTSSPTVATTSVAFTAART